MDGNLLQEAIVWARQTMPERDGKPVPSEAFSGYVALCPQTVVELVIADKVEEPFGGKVLLHYRGGMWNAWHTIGGFVHAGESMHAACKRHATDLGLEIEVVTGVGINGMIGWREDMTHPYGWANNGHLVQHYFLCRATSTVVETAELKWFSEEDIPHPLLRGHEDHTDAYYALR
jgi:ADP-ribose pyrophosphatase YjhB (NUDIX family)